MCSDAVWRIVFILIVAGTLHAHDGLHVFLVSLRLYLSDYIAGVKLLVCAFTSCIRHIKLNAL